MIIFIIVFLLLYSLVCFYVGYNGWVWLRKTKFSRYKQVYTVFVVLLSLSFFLERFFASKILSFISGSWLILIGYGLILLPVINLFYFIFKKKHIHILGSAVSVFFLFIITFGSYNAWVPVVKTYEVTVDKSSQQKKINVLMASDLHLGNTVGKSHLERLVEIVDEKKPDIILIPGDIINDHIEPFINENMGETLKKIKAPLGVYATSGNHDYYGNDLKKMVEEMKKAGINVLSDESVLINDSFYIVGRNDLTDKNRKSIEDLMSDLDKSRPVIMLDHQSDEIRVAAQNGVDVLVSGHTHGGQIAPGNLITGMIYENDYGYLKKKNLHSIVSSGFGLWGPPFRIGTQSEVVELIFNFK